MGSSLPLAFVEILYNNGSSGKRVPGVVEIVKPKFEVLHVAEAIGLPLHGLDFVVQASQRAVGDLVGIIAKQALLDRSVDPTALSCLMPEVRASKHQLRRKDLACSAVP